MFFIAYIFNLSTLNLILCVLVIILATITCFDILAYVPVVNNSLDKDLKNFILKYLKEIANFDNYSSVIMIIL